MTAGDNAADPSSRFEQALNAPDPFPAAFALAEQLRDEGMSQLDLYLLYERFRAHHAEDVDQTRLNAVLDTMDMIVSWCFPSRRLYPEELKPGEV